MAHKLALYLCFGNKLSMSMSMSMSYRQAWQVNKNLRVIYMLISFSSNRVVSIETIPKCLISYYPCTGWCRVSGARGKNSRQPPSSESFWESRCSFVRYRIKNVLSNYIHSNSTLSPPRVDLSPPRVDLEMRTRDGRRRILFIPTRSGLKRFWCLFWP
jgi:hypothetical protein